MKVSIKTNTDGKGLWTDEVRSVLIQELKIGYSSLEYYPEDKFNGELRAYFEPSGFTPDSWNIDGYGLIYTDKKWLKEFKAGLRELGFSIRAVQNVGYSEQGMQSFNYVSLDIGHQFYSSWVRLHKKLSLPL